MKRNLLGAIIVAAVVSAAPFGAAKAADMPVKVPTVAWPPPCPFCGWYAGLNVGFMGSSGSGFNNQGFDTDTGGVGNAISVGAIPNSIAADYVAFLGGGQIGYNFSPFKDEIIGFEWDIDGINLKKTTTSGPFVVPPTVTVPVTTVFGQQADWVSTFRARIGPSVLNNSFMPYLTAGLAMGEVGISNQFICPACAPSTATEPSTSASSKITRLGLTAGAGVEWMIVPHFSVRMEYIYVDLGHISSTVLYTYGANTSTMTSFLRASENIARMGVNWHF